MSLERNGYYRNLRPLHDECKKCLYYHVVLTMMDGSIFDGIIEEIDDDQITVLAGEDVMDPDEENQTNESRQPHGYGRPRRKFRRFRRRRFPLANLVKLSLLPYIAPPFFYPYF